MGREKWKERNDDEEGGRDRKKGVKVEKEIEVNGWTL